MSSVPPPPPPIKLSDDDIEIIDDVVDLGEIFELQASLMEHFRRAGFPMPHYPVDIMKKENQRICRDTGLKAIEELFEAIQHLKNWKPHRRTEVPEFDRDAFLEEIADSLHYLFELLVFLGVSPRELKDAYARKNRINHDRIDNGY